MRKANFNLSLLFVTRLETGLDENLCVRYLDIGPEYHRESKGDSSSFHICTRAPTTQLANILVFFLKIFLFLYEHNPVTCFRSQP